MKVSLIGLKVMSLLEESPEAIADVLTKLGLEVEGITPIGHIDRNLVTAKVLEREQHPNADKLSVCKVTDGENEFQVVCGAPMCSRTNRYFCSCWGGFTW